MKESTLSPRDYAAFTMDHRYQPACLENKASRSSLSLVTVSGGTEWQIAQQSAGETVLVDIASYSVTSIRRPASSVTTLTYSTAKKGCAPIDGVWSRMRRLHWPRYKPSHVPWNMSGMSPQRLMHHITWAWLNDCGCIWGSLFALHGPSNTCNVGDLVDYPYSSHQITRAYDILYFSRPFTFSTMESGSSGQPKSLMCFKSTYIECRLCPRPHDGTIIIVDPRLTVGQLNVTVSGSVSSWTCKSLGRFPCQWKKLTSCYLFRTWLISFLREWASLTMHRI